jgi:DNA-binding response OmpR family regulator
MKTRILFVEDETDLGNVVKQYLEIMDFEVEWCTNGAMALDKFRQHQGDYDILVLDVSMPEMDGFELADQVIQLNQNIPFLFLTARNEKKDKLHGLKLGADDYIVKPFDIDELVLRIRNIIKRHQSDAHHTLPAASCIQKHDVKFYKDTLRLLIGEKEIMLTVREAQLLEFLFNHENRILKREEILQQLWGENDYFLGRSLDVFISRLRKHLSQSSKVSINNVYGVGFVFSC